ncbi:MAG: hypothetical protein IT439_00355 [Phycisphaerales bacterium]|nr:hypothetical protein [Phycisphaerales bacterium]
MASDVTPPAPGTKRRRRVPSDPAPAAPRLIVKRVGTVPVDLGPGDVIWSAAPALDVPLQPQITTMPTLTTATVTSISVQGVTDGARVAWRFSWADAHPAMETETGRFSDAVGIQFPMAPDAPYLMGGPGLPVRSIYWKALWQRDVDEGFVDVTTLYPNAWSDLYWFAEGGAPARVPASFKDVRSRPWFVPLSAGNPVSEQHRSTPVEEITAEGFGSLTHVPDGVADGRGAWQEGAWGVVIHRPITNDALSGLFAPGKASTFAVAVWDGDAGNAGGRKHHSLWVEYEVEK